MDIQELREDTTRQFTEVKACISDLENKVDTWLLEYNKYLLVTVFKYVVLPLIIITGGLVGISLSGVTV